MADAAPVVPETPAAPEAEAAPVVLLTVLQNADGSFQLTPGDEPEGDAAPAGASYPDSAALMKAVLDIVKSAENGGEDADAQFDEGFTGEPAAPAAPEAPVAAA